VANGPNIFQMLLVAYYCLVPAHWLRGTVVERRSLAGEFFLFHARLAADGWSTIVGKPSATGQPTRPTQPLSFRGR